MLVNNLVFLIEGFWCNDFILYIVDQVFLFIDQLLQLYTFVIRLRQNNLPFSFGIDEMVIPWSLLRIPSFHLRTFPLSWVQAAVWALVPWWRASPCHSRPLARHATSWSSPRRRWPAFLWSSSAPSCPGLPAGFCFLHRHPQPTWASSLETSFALSIEVFFCWSCLWGT